MSCTLASLLLCLDLSGLYIDGSLATLDSGVEQYGRDTSTIVVVDRGWVRSTSYQESNWYSHRTQNPHGRVAIGYEHEFYRFVAWINGKPDFRVMDGAKIPIAVKQRRCWLCGSQLGKFMTFCLGPMCAINRTISEPPSHLDCMEFSVKACPFLSMPKAQRRENNLPEAGREAAGVGLKRNPGVTLLWTTRSYGIFRAGTDSGSNDGILFRVGDPVKLAWYAEGREATREECLASINGGLHYLEAIAAQQGPESTAALGMYVERAMTLLPAA